MRWSLGLWLVIIAAFIAYVFADAAFDVSKTISRFIRLRARPVLRRVWGAVVGRLPARAAPAAKQAYTTPEPHIERPMQGSIQAPAVLAFLWKAKWAILFLLLFVFGVGALRGCVPFDFAKSRDTLRAERNAERLNTEVAKHEADLGALSAELAERSQTRARRADAIVAQADQDLEDAVSQDDFDALYRAYRNGYDGLWDDLRPSDSPDPSEGRPARLPGARAHAS